MADGVEIRIDGASDVIRRLNAYSLQLGDRVTLLALRSGANFLRKKIKAAAPLGKTGRLKRSIRVQRSKINTRARRGAVGVFVRAFKGREKNDEKGAYYAHFVEDGHKTRGLSRVAASKFIKNTFNDNKFVMLELITKSIEKGGGDLARRLNL